MSERKSRRRNAANAPVKPVEIFFAPTLAQTAPNAWIWRESSESPSGDSRMAPRPSAFCTCRARACDAVLLPCRSWWRVGRRTAFQL